LLPRVIDVALSLRKLAVHRTIPSGIPFILSLWISLSWDTLSNAPATSSDSRLATLSLP
jgi:hypothetical protein